MRLTKSFFLEEFGKDIPKYFVDAEGRQHAVIDNLQSLALVLQVIRDDAGVPVVISSGFRTPEVNRAVGGVRGSQHLLGKAADFRVTGQTSLATFRRIKELVAQGQLPKLGLGYYRSHVHLDIRETGRMVVWRA